MRATKLVNSCCLLHNLCPCAGAQAETLDGCLKFIGFKAIALLRGHGHAARQGSAAACAVGSRTRAAAAAARCGCWMTRPRCAAQVKS